MDPILIANTIIDLLRLCVTNSRFYRRIQINHKIEDEEYEKQVRQSKNEEFIEQTGECVKKNVSKISKENIQDPNPSVIYPAIYELPLYLHEEEIREMFSKLIASSYDKSKTEYLHPGFIGIIKQLSPYDARLLSSINELANITGYIAIDKSTKTEYKLIDAFEIKEVEDVLQLSLSLDNLMRLGLINIESVINSPRKDKEGNVFMLNTTIPIKTDSRYNDLLHEKYDLYFAKAYITVLGINFLKVCVD